MKRRKSGLTSRFLIASLIALFPIGVIGGVMLLHLFAIKISSPIILFCLLFFTLITSVIVTLVQNKKLREYIQNKKKVEKTLTKLSSAVTHCGASIIITNTQGIIEYVNERFIQISGYSRVNAIGESIEILNACNLNTNEIIASWSKENLTSNWEGEILSQRADGSTFWGATTISAVYDEFNKISNYVISAVDITPLKEVNDKMQQLALFDSLTGLANRRLFIDRLNQSIIAAKRHQNLTALLFLDLDQFKRINDTLGHDVGDVLLTEIANRLKACVRAQDTVARLGGDEFTILLNDVPESSAVTHVAKNILGSLKRPMKINKNEIIISTSIGITLFPGDGEDVDVLMKNADLALYRAKEQGRDRYHFFTEELNVHAIRMMHVEQELRKALQFNEFSLQFQPQVNLKNGGISSIEAYIRWQHPERGEITPSEFIAIAEETGLILPIGEWVLKNACMQTRLLQQLTRQKIKVSVNLSARQFHDPGLQQLIIDELESSGLEAEYLELEITESMLMEDPELVKKQLVKIKKTGVTITIDDFGSGYSSLNLLRKLPVDMLKVDRSFVNDIPENLQNMEITSAVIAIAHKLNLKVIAEGVENLDQRDYLIINQCDFAQGYFFSKPLSFEELYNFFNEATLQIA
jgi:diguanylate cyclase (GGDEF)-like protein/PAS domain S-box-containing protein